MLDRKFILENAEAVAQNCVNRKVNVDIPRFVELETQRKAMQQEIESLNAQANATSKSIGKAKDAAERDALKEQGRQLRESVAAKTVELDALTAELDAIHRAIPNMSHPDAPIGEDDKSNLEVGRGATPVPTFDFPVLDHVQLAEKWDMIDFEGGARVAGAGFYFLKNDAVLLDLALQRFAIGILLVELLESNHRILNL